MKGSIYRYLQIRATQWASYPQRGPMESSKAICKDSFFDAIESKDCGDKNEEARRFLEQNRLKVCYDAQSRFLGGKLNPNDLSEEEHGRAKVTLIEAVDEVKYLDARGVVFLAGKWQPETKDQAYAQLLKTAQVVHGYAVAKGMAVELEVFDYDMDKATFTGPTLYTTEFTADMRTTHSSPELLVDLSHSPATYETDRFVVCTLRSYIAHLHFRSAIVVRSYDGYDDPHPKLGYLNSANDILQLLNYLKVVEEKGFFDAKSPYVLSMEVILRPGKDGGIALANIKRVLNRAQALLEDNI